MSLNSIEDALSAIAAGKFAVVVDDENRENEGDLIMAADLASPEAIAFMVRHTSGVICAALTGDALDRLRLPLMVADNRESMRTAYTITVDAAAGISTGISAADRAHTIRLLADPASGPADFNRPGHIFPLRYAEGGVLRRPGHTEAAVDLARLAGRASAGILAEIVNDDGSMARLPQLIDFARRHHLAVISIADLIAHRLRHDGPVARVASARLPTRHGTFTTHAYRCTLTGVEHLALTMGDPTAEPAPLVRVHSECLTGDALGSRRCDCGDQLNLALATIAQRGRGIVVYLRDQEGRGIGLANKIRAYGLQDGGADTVDANLRLDLPADDRDYTIAAHILRDLGISALRLITNNPAKRAALEAAGLTVTERVAQPTAIHADNRAYLTTKQERLGHLLLVPAQARTA